jgi:hypothetical protein
MFSLNGVPATEVRAALLPAAREIVDAVVTAVRLQGREVDWFDEGFEWNLRRGLLDAVERWFGDSRPSSDAELHFGLGRAQARAGRSSEELMGVYRIAGQTAWRSATEIGAPKSVPAEDLYLLGETGFAYVDELSAHVAAGVAEEQAHRSGVWHLRRNGLVRLLPLEPPTARDVLRAAARVAGVELGEAVAF